MRYGQKKTVVGSTLATVSRIVVILTLAMSLGANSSSAELLARKKPKPPTNVPPSNVPQNFVLTKTVVHPSVPQFPIGTSAKPWNQLDLSWSAVTNATHYELECTSDSSTPLGRSRTTRIIRVTPTSYRRTGNRDAMWRLEYRVRSVMKDGTTSAWSTMQSVNMI